MHPILIQIGPLSIKTYGFFIAVGFLTGIALALAEAKRLNFDRQFILDLAFYIILAALIGSRAYYVFSNLSYFIQHPLDIFKVWQGGLTFIGGFICALATCIYMIQKRGMPLWETLDIFAPSLAVGVFFGRLGCFSAGCCYGSPCDLPWAVTFTDPHTLARPDIALHPTQLYSAGGALITFLVLFLLRKRKSFHGQLTLLWVMLYCSFRSVIEQFRGDIRSDMLMGRYSVTLVLSIIFILAAAALYPVLKKKNPC
jgi:phosphatidylglycerol:prolipoprotein diacylglycerol transferase